MEVQGVAGGMLERKRICFTSFPMLSGNSMHIPFSQSEDRFIGCCGAICHLDFKFAPILPMLYAPRCLHVKKATASNFSEMLHLQTSGPLLILLQKHALLQTLVRRSSCQCQLSTLQLLLLEGRSP